MRHFTVKADHPFWRFADPSLVLSARGVWRVIWRDFFGMRQDEEFTTEAEAKKYAEEHRRRVKPPLRISLTDHCVEDIEAADQFWRDTMLAPVRLVSSTELPAPVQKLISFAPAHLRVEIPKKFCEARGDSPIERVLATAVWFECERAGKRLWIVSSAVGSSGPASTVDTDSLCFASQVWVLGWPVDFVLWAYDGTAWRKLLIECDGHQYHAVTKEQASRDRERDRQVQLRGMTILRFTGSEIWADPAGCAASVLQWVDGLRAKSGAA